jgi:hypothetical protein
VVDDDPDDLPPRKSAAGAIVVALLCLGCVGVGLLLLILADSFNGTQPPRERAAAGDARPADWQAPAEPHAAVNPGGMLLTVALCVAGIVFYILPSVIAFSRGHQNSAAILAVNLLLGCIVLGWIAALVWSLTEVRTRENLHYHYHR